MAPHLSITLPSLANLVLIQRGVVVLSVHLSFRSLCRTPPGRGGADRSSPLCGELACTHTHTHMHVRMLLPHPLGTTSPTAPPTVSHPSYCPTHCVPPLLLPHPLCPTPPTAPPTGSHPSCPTHLVPPLLPPHPFDHTPQLPAQEGHCPRQPDTGHHLHPARRLGQDWGWYVSLQEYARVCTS